MKPLLKLMSFSEWLESNPDMRRKKPEQAPCMRCCDKYGNTRASRKNPSKNVKCIACGNKRTVEVTTYDIYKAQIEKDRANLQAAGIAFIDIAI